jgi:hypothetical protein
MKNRANVVRLLSAGYQRIVVPAQRPADRSVAPRWSRGHPAPVAGVPDDLRATLVEPLAAARRDHGTVRAAAGQRRPALPDRTHLRACRTISTSWPARSSTCAANR